MRRTASNSPRPLHYYCFYEAKLCLRKLIRLLFFSQSTPLHLSAYHGHLEFTRLLVESKADVAARDWCFSPPPSHHLSLTICLAATVELHSDGPKETTWLHTCAASERLKCPPALRPRCPLSAGGARRLQPARVVVPSKAQVLLRGEKRSAAHAIHAFQPLSHSTTPTSPRFSKAESYLTPSPSTRSRTTSLAATQICATFRSSMTASAACILCCSTEITATRLCSTQVPKMEAY